MVAQHLIGKAIRSRFLQFFPDPDKGKKKLKRKEQQPAPSPYKDVKEWFGAGNTLDLLLEDNDAKFRESLDQVAGLAAVVEKFLPGLNPEEQYFFMEFALHGLAEFSQLSKGRLEAGVQFKDLFDSVFSVEDFLGEEEE
jgi:magnesium chelatase subunit I